ncbi:MAG TPA: M4 family metallopeptidase [Haliangiales bacterium]|nr:M4 family metallopeptidase [Haliangiales bacterium]
MPPDIAAAVVALPEAQVVATTNDGVPTFIVGDMGRVGATQDDNRAAADLAIRPQLAAVIAPFRLASSNLILSSLHTDDQGYRHFRYRQVQDGLDVVGGDLIVHVDIKGSIYLVNGTARGDLAVAQAKTGIGASEALSRVGQDPRYAGMLTSSARMVYLLNPDGQMYKAYETIAEGFRGADPVRDKVYVDVATGNLVATHPQIYFAENRAVYSANNGTSLPGTLKRSEGQAATTDVDVNAAYDNTGDTWEFYHEHFTRDSYDNAGAQLKSSVHYSVNYCNAFWNSTQMVYGDGNTAQNCFPLARAVDVTAHELTHAVTERESGLVYSGESGGLNEALSDIFGAATEAFVDGGKTGTLAVSANTWKVGEQILPPYLRLMNDPAADGNSADFWYSGVGNLDVHYSSGIANLAFYLLSQGGTHPRGKSSVVVPALGIDKAIRIFYKAQVDILTPSVTYAQAANAFISAAQQLYGATEADATTKAWQAVGVGAQTPPPPPTTTVLQNGVPVTGLSDSLNGQKFFKLSVPSGATNLSFQISGGTGDADLYVKFGAQPTLTSYDCRPYLTGNNETCNIATAQTGDYFVMLNAYAAYSGVTLKGSYSTGTPPPPGGDVLQNGVATAVTPDLATGQWHYYTFTVPSTATSLTFVTTGISGDADLYVRRNADPTTTVNDGASEGSTTSESITITSGFAATWHVGIYGYASPKGVKVTATYGTATDNTPELPAGGVSGLSGALGSQQFWKISNVAAGKTVTVTISGFSGDADLYTRRNAKPTTLLWDCRPYFGTGATETCTAVAPAGAASTYYIMVRGYTAYANARLTGTVQ